LIGYPLLRKLLFAVDAETVHEWVLQVTCLLEPVGRWLRPWTQVSDPVQVGSLKFPNRVGLAAGFDKNARWIGVAESLGFGHIEVGAVTPRPQPGHPRPRLFRLPEHGALRNRMGFNNEGLQTIAQRLAGWQNRRQIRVGVNLGKNSDTPLEEAASDYQQVMDGCAEVCDFYTLNVSSPNTEGLRSLSQVDSLQALLGALRWSRPLWLKLSPDEDLDTYREIGRRARDWGLEGIVFSNTTLRRNPPLDGVDPLGGVSGRPLLQPNLAVLRQVTWSVPVIGAGGIFDENDALQYRRAGASLVQVYTGMIYAGPGLPGRLARSLRKDAK
jgi:dihydroorotate dehydrogenase